jgi:hypothetical protein
MGSWMQNEDDPRGHPLIPPVYTYAVIFPRTPTDRCLARVVSRDVKHAPRRIRGCAGGHGADRVAESSVLGGTGVPGLGEVLEAP